MNVSKIIQDEIGRHDFAGERGPTSQTGCNGGLGEGGRIYPCTWRGVGLNQADFDRHVARRIAMRLGVEFFDRSDRMLIGRALLRRGS